MWNGKTVAVILPTYNEAASIRASIEAFQDTGVVDLVLTCSYYTAINMAQTALKPEMDPGKASTL